MNENPFGVRNPEHVPSEYIASHFVEVLTDVPRLKDLANTFIHGARGTGKSMLLRSLEPAVMILRGNQAKVLTDLPFLAIHVPLKKAEFSNPEIDQFQGFEATAIGEHLLVMHVMLRISELLERLAPSISASSADIYRTRFRHLFVLSGGEVAAEEFPAPQESASHFRWILDVCEAEILTVRQYLVRTPFRPSDKSYQGALTGFLDFLVPLARAVGKLDGLPEVPLFVMLDDADNLTVPMQKVLNSWVSTRSTGAICLKITTQLAYATFRTVDNRIIESPHDFSEVNLAAVYTSSLDGYSRRVRDIIDLRLKNAQINASADHFFPCDLEQIARLKEIEQEIEQEHRERTDGSGASRSRDERRRYAVPRLMRELTGPSRSAHTYSYAGFQSLVDLSSGVVRWLLEPASRMYDRVASAKPETITEIPVRVQDDVIRQWSREFLDTLNPRTDDGSDEDGASSNDEVQERLSRHSIGHETEMYDRLRNLIEGMGILFRQRLLNDQVSEQRVFSIILRDRPSRSLADVLDLGMRLGYLQKSDNAAKEALGGRRPRYMLARRLGPYYKLDVSGHAAHLSVTAGDLELAIQDPISFVKKRGQQLGQEPAQFSLELGGEKL